MKQPQHDQRKAEQDACAAVQELNALNAMLFAAGSICIADGPVDERKKAAFDEWLNGRALDVGKEVRRMRARRMARARQLMRWCDLCDIATHV